jgi:hypothetical protein
MANKQKFPSEIVDLPSKGLLYPEDSPLRSGKVEIKYMTAKEEDILTSQNLIKKGIVIDSLLKSLIMTEGVNTDDMLLGDKNATMVAARILAYGADYECEVINPNTGEKFKHKFDLTDCPFKEMSKDIDYSKNEFEVELPISKSKITFKLLTGRDENEILKEVNRVKKLGAGTTEITTRLRKVITSVNGETAPATINNFVNNMLSKDSLFLRGYIADVTPDIDLKQEIYAEGETVTLDIPMTVDFFWPKAGS